MPALRQVVVKSFLEGLSIDATIDVLFVLSPRVIVFSSL